MNRHNHSSAIRMFLSCMTAFLMNFEKPQSFECFAQIFFTYRRQFAHTVTLTFCTPTNSKGVIFCSSDSAQTSIWILLFFSGLRDSFSLRIAAFDIRNHTYIDSVFSLLNQCSKIHNFFIVNKVHLVSGTLFSASQLNCKISQGVWFRHKKPVSNTKRIFSVKNFALIIQILICKIIFL